MGAKRLMVVPAGDRLLPAPFIELLLANVVSFDGDGYEGGEGILGLAERLGVGERTVRRWLALAHDPRESGMPQVDVVDRCALQLDTSIAELYGPMYEIARIPDSEGRLRRRADRPPVCLCSRCGEMMLTVAPMCGFCEGELAS